MSVDPTQPMSPPAPAGADLAEQAAPEQAAPQQAAPEQAPEQAAQQQAAQQQAAQQQAAQQQAAPEQVAPTRVQPIQQPAGGGPGGSPQPSFTPAQPSFTPAQPAQAAQPAQPAAPAQAPHSGQPFQAAQAAAPAQAAQLAQSAQLAQPASPAQPAFQPSGWPGESFSQPGEAGRQDAGQGGWPEQPPQYTSQEGWPQPYAGMPDGPGTGAPGGRLGHPVRPPRRRRRMRRSVMALFTIIVLLILATIGDRVANAVAENTIANQFVKNGLAVKPSVTIEGFPFLTQLLAHDIRKIDISASGVPAGPVTITSVNGTLTGVHINSSFNGGTVDHIAATAFISFSSLASAGGVGGLPGLTMTPDGPNKLKVDAAGVDLAELQISQTGPRQISVRVLNSGPLGGLANGLGNGFTGFSFELPQGVPASVHITGLSLNAQGLTVSAAANNATLSQS